MKRHDIDGSNHPKGGEVAIGEIGASFAKGIEPVSENDFLRDADLEAFMNEKVCIMIHEDQNKDSLDIETPSVNGVNQPIIRGQKTWVKRKYVEAIARATMTRFVQHQPDPTRIDYIQMVEKIVPCLPFSVYEDPHPRGREWLDRIVRGTSAIR
jgi:hypothetical protein